MIDKIKSIKKETIQLVAVGIIAVILMMIFLYRNIFSSSDATVDGKDGVVLTEGGEASYMNLSVPSAKVKNDSLSIIDKIDKIKQDSINKSRISDIGINDVENNEKIKIINSSPGRVNRGNNYSSGNYGRSNSKEPSYRQSRGSSYNNTYKSIKNVEADDVSEDPEPAVAIKRNVIVDNGFFSSSSGSSRSTSNIDNSNDEEITLKTDRLIYASVHTDQLIMDNTRVKLRLTKGTVIDNIKYSINTIVYGIAKISRNRLFVDITSINQNRSNDLELYDAEDSGKGIYVVTPILNASLKKELGNDALEDDNRDFDRIPFSRTLKMFFQKKIKEEKIELLNNYKVIIKKKEKNEN